MIIASLHIVHTIGSSRTQQWFSFSPSRERERERDRWMDGWINGWINGWIDRWLFDNYLEIAGQAASWPAISSSSGSASLLADGINSAHNSSRARLGGAVGDVRDNNLARPHLGGSCAGRRRFGRRAETQTQHNPLCPPARSRRRA